MDLDIDGRQSILGRVDHTTHNQLSFKHKYTELKEKSIATMIQNFLTFVKFIYNNFYINPLKS